MSIIDQEISTNRSFNSEPPETGLFKIGFEIWCHGKLIEEGEGFAKFDGVWEFTEAEEQGEGFRNIVWWEFI